jgi:hypothetical protein
MNKNELMKKVEEAYAATLIKGYKDLEVMKRLEAYDELVDELVALTEGKDNAYKTDPMGALDYKALTGKSFAGMTYNELAEALGSFAFGE